MGTPLDSSRSLLPADVFWYPPHVLGWRVEAVTGFVLPTLIPSNRPQFVGRLKIHGR